MLCSAGDRCLFPQKGDTDPEAQYDRYNIYAGRWHEECWGRFGYGDFVFDPSYAGESLDEEY